MLLGQGQTADPVSPNERVQIGVIGVGVRGKYLIANLPPEARVVSVCDCFLPRCEELRHPQGRFAEPLARFAATDAARCAIHQDYRRVLDSRDVDAVIIAAPDHHHVRAAMLACLAGKDVYIEKPLSLTISEGRSLVDVVNKTRRIVQVGSQQRTMQVNRRGCEFIRHGGLGRIRYVETDNLPGPMPLPERPAQDIPAGLDWDLFCGPVHPPRYHRDLWDKDAYKFGYLTWRGWDLFRDFSGHLMTNWGGHDMDMVQLALGTEETGPVEIVPRPDEIDVFIDDQWHEKTPPLGAVTDKRRDLLRFCPVTLAYADGLEVRLTPGVSKQIFHGERGTLWMSRNEVRTDPPELAPAIDFEELARWEGDGNVARPHLENWLDAIRLGRPLNAPIEPGHRTATICHLVNIARELARRLKWDPVAERFPGDAEANALLTRQRRRGWELPAV